MQAKVLASLIFDAGSNSNILWIVEILKEINGKVFIWIRSYNDLLGELNKILSLRKKLFVKL